MNINAYQIEYHISQKELKEYATFCYFKYLYRNGCIYNYTSIKLATKCKYSASFIRKSIKTFIAKGWCSMHGNNLIFNKSTSFNGTESKIRLYNEVNIKRISIKEILEYFELQIIGLHDSKFSKIKKLKRDLKSNKISIRHKAEDYADSIGKKTKAQRDTLPDETAKLKLSNGKLSRIFGCSAGKASKIVNTLARKGFITIHRKINKTKLTGKLCDRAIRVAKDLGYSYGYGNHLFVVETLEFTIN